MDMGMEVIGEEDDFEDVLWEEAEAVMGPLLYIRINEPLGQKMSLESYQELNGPQLEAARAYIRQHVPQQIFRFDLYEITLNQKFILQSIYNENDDNFPNIYQIIDPQRNNEVRIVTSIPPQLEYDEHSVNIADVENTFPIFKIVEQVTVMTYRINAQRFVEIYNLLQNNYIIFFDRRQELITNEDSNILDYYINIMDKRKHWTENTGSCINLNSIKNCIELLLLHIRNQIPVATNSYYHVFNAIKIGIEKILDSYLEIIVANSNIIVGNRTSFRSQPGYEHIDINENNDDLQIFSDVLYNLCQEYKEYIDNIGHITSTNNTHEWNRLNIYVNSIYASELDYTIEDKIYEVYEDIQYDMSIIRERIDSHNARDNDHSKLIQLQQEIDKLDTLRANNKRYYGR